MNKQEKFSVKKLLLTILCSSIISVFIGSTIIFIQSLYSNVEVEIINNLDKNDPIIIQIRDSHEAIVENIKEEIKKDKTDFGEDYPAEAIFLYNFYNTAANKYLDIYWLSIFIGVIFGIIVYIIAIQKANIKKSLIEIIISFIILYLILMIINFGYGFLIKNMINSAGATSETYLHYVYDLYYVDIANMVIIYLIIGLVVFIFNYIRQKILTNKLNKELTK